MSRTALRALVALTLSAGVAGAQRPAANRPAPAAPGAGLEQIMAPWEREATGVARLSATERQALEAWLGRYAAAVRAGRAPAPAASLGPVPNARSTFPGAPAPMDTIRPAPRSEPAGEPRPSTGPTRIAISVDPSPPAVTIASVYDGGDVIATEDGSLWEIYLPDRASTAAWVAGQSLVVRPNLLPPQLYGPAYDVSIVNGETRTRAAARYAGRQRTDPAGQ